MANWTAAVVLYPKHHPEDGLIPGRNMLVKILQTEIRHKYIFWLSVHFVTLGTWRILKQQAVAHQCYHHHHHHHHHHHQGLDPLIRSVSTVTAARANASSVFQLFSFLVVCSGMISKGFGFVAFFASVKASSVCIHLSISAACIHLGFWSRSPVRHKLWSRY